MIQKPRGTKDLFGKDLDLYKHIVSTLERIFTIFGYEEIKTPIFEKKEVFDKSDLSNLLANKEYFYIKDRKYSDEESDTFSCVLRPELTAPIIRSLVENKILNRQTESKSLNYFYCGECFRYDRPQEGRFRQFIQMGIEKVNSNSIYHDMENVLILKTISELFGLKNVKIKINYFGSSETKNKWNESLKKYFQQNIDKLTGDSKKRIEINPFRIFDESKCEDSDLILSSPKIIDFFSDKEKQDFCTLSDYFSEYSDVEWDFFLVRGLDYYTGLIYELVDISSGLSLAAGGRYDDLVQMFYGKKIPALGLAVGVDRIKHLLDQTSFDHKNPVKKIVVFSSSDLSEQIFWKKIFKFKKSLIFESESPKVIVEPKRKVSQKYLLEKYGQDSEIFDIFSYEL